MINFKKNKQSHQLIYSRPKINPVWICVLLNDTAMEIKRVTAKLYSSTLYLFANHHATRNVIARFERRISLSVNI